MGCAARARRTSHSLVSPDAIEQAQRASAANCAIGGYQNRVVYDSEEAIDDSGTAPDTFRSIAAPDLKRVHVPQNADDETLCFESRFEGGNMRRAVQVFSHEYDLLLNFDHRTTSHTQWYFFSMANTRKNRTYTLRFINMCKPESLCSGMRPLMWSTKEAKFNNLGWHRCASNVAYYPNGIARKDKNGQLSSRCFYTLSFRLTFAHDKDEVFLTYYRITTRRCAASSRRA